MGGPILGLWPHSVWPGVHQPQRQVVQARDQRQDAGHTELETRAQTIGEAAQEHHQGVGEAVRAGES